MASKLSLRKSFADARAFARSLNLSTYKEYVDWVRENGRQHGMPVSPQHVYPEFDGYPDFLGTNRKRRQKKTNQANVLSFAEARVYMQQFGLKNQREFTTWSKYNRPSSIPSNPRQFYKDEWTSMDDFLGYKKAYRPFLEARDYARSKSFHSREEWMNFAKTSEFPSDVPIHPARPYRLNGWCGWGDFLGFYTRWNRLSIVGFLDSIKPVIGELSELDLYLILSRNGMLHRNLRLRGGKLLRGLTKLKAAEDIEALKEQLAEEIAGENSEAENSTVDGGTVAEHTAHDDLVGSDTEFLDDIPGSLPHLKSLEHFLTVDRVVEARITDDPEVIEAMIDGRVNAFWQLAMDGDEESVVAEASKMEGGIYFNEIRSRFLEEYEQVRQIALPPGYAFANPSGTTLQPNLMQRLTAHRLQTRMRLGNWSGVGAGKTKAAILSAGILNSELTVILVANATIDEWELQIKQVFSEDRIAVQSKEPRDFHVEAGKLNFLLLNYELFQQSWSEEVFGQFVNHHKIGFIVLDEVQFAKQRHKVDEDESEPNRARSRKSKRRHLIEAFLLNAAKKNSELRVMAMSATPVINNLREAVKTLELIYPEDDFTQVPLAPSISNMIEVHMLLRRNGIRHCPQYDIELVKTPVELDGMELFSELSLIRAQEILKMEQALLRVKLKYLPQQVERGTLVYTHYVDKIIEPITKVIEAKGLRVQHFTGESRVSIAQFVEDFEKGRVDVLVGSQPVGTGVNRLQYVLNRIVFVTLPWSNAEYEQIVGRLWRQNSEFQKVEVFIPQVVLREERVGIWSWDDLRLRCIEFKRNLADVVLDGIIPHGGLPSQQELHRRSLVALKVWAENVASGLPTDSFSDLETMSPSEVPDSRPAP